jgi:hypothetical protein
LLFDALLSVPTEHPPCLTPQAKSYGDAELLDRLESKARIITLQQRLADSLAAVGEPGGSGGHVQFASHPRASAAPLLLASRIQPPFPRLAQHAFACSCCSARRGFQGGGRGSRQRAAGSPQATGSLIQRLCNPLPGGHHSKAQRRAGRAVLFQPAGGFVGMGQQQCLGFFLPADLSANCSPLIPACATYCLPCRTGRYAWRWFTSPTSAIATMSASCGI